ncbi:hypothetical protein F66182_13817 [Fusarium sp. NRRL 66182]|nr:hypothetical protein F66182_13817 [Fusarium sp. NRRL 66182]
MKSTCIASTIRIVELTRFVPRDATYSQGMGSSHSADVRANTSVSVYSSTWTDIEMGVAVISGNLPLLAPIFERFLGRNASTRRYYYGSSGRDGDGFALKYHHGGSVSRGPAKIMTSSESTSRNFKRFSDTNQPVRPGAADVELEDRAILVRTQVDIVSDPVDSENEVRTTVERKARNKW